MSDRPSVSVVIPTKNRWSLASRTALPSALSQEGIEYEVVIVDDGSTDETALGLAELVIRDPRIRVLRHDESRGVAAARNTGIAAARAPWLAFLDDDDIWSPRKLTLQLGAARRTGADWGYAGAVAVSDAGQLLYQYYLPDPACIDAQLRSAAVVPAGASNVVARTDVVRRAGGFDEGFSMLADWDLWIRLAETSVPVALHEVLVAVLFHPHSGHAVTDQSAELERLIDKYAARTPPVLLDVDVLGHARWVASEHSRAGRHLRAAWLYARDAWRYRSPSNMLRAADALLGKKPGSFVAARDDSPVPPAPEAMPSWLGRSVYLDLPG